MAIQLPNFTQKKVEKGEIAKPKLLLANTI